MWKNWWPNSQFSLCRGHPARLVWLSAKFPSSHDNTWFKSPFYILECHQPPNISLLTIFQAKEREVQRKQLEDIFKLMEQNNDKFGIKSFDDIQDQMTLYAQWKHLFNSHEVHSFILNTFFTMYYSPIIVLTMSPTVNFRDHDGRITMSKYSVWSPFTVNDWICVREFKNYFAATSHHFLEPLVHKFIIASGCHYFSYWRPNNKYWCPKFKWTSKNNSILRTLRHLVFCTKELAMQVLMLLTCNK